MSPERILTLVRELDVYTHRAGHEGKVERLQRQLQALERALNEVERELGRNFFA